MVNYCAAAYQSVINDDGDQAGGDDDDGDDDGGGTAPGYLGTLITVCSRINKLSHHQYWPRICGKVVPGTYINEAVIVIMPH